MIRCQLIFNVKEDIMLNYNYNHSVMKNIYHYIQKADDILSRRLHNEGFKSDKGQRYKLFNFTLLFENAIFNSEGIHCNKDTVIKLIISGEEDIVNKIVKGVMHIRKCKIEDSELILQSIEKDKKIYWKKVMLYHTLSPVVESTRNDEGKVVYQSTFELGYYENLANNAKRKYKIMYGEEYKGELYFDIDNALAVKEKFTRIKNGGVKGYEYDIWIECDIAMQKVIYYLGLGQNSSTGLGCLNFVKGFDEECC